jgi:hypothetical protein
MSNKDAAPSEKTGPTIKHAYALVELCMCEKHDTIICIGQGGDEVETYGFKMPSWRHNLKEVHALWHVVYLEGAVSSHQSTVFPAKQ